MVIFQTELQKRSEATQLKCLRDQNSNPFTENLSSLQKVCLNL